MNAQLISDGYSWVVVPVGRREEYMQALEKASVEGDITNFGALAKPCVCKKFDLDLESSKRSLIFAPSK